MDLHGGGNATLGLAAIDDRVNGECGLWFLGSGFVLQAIGYVATTARSGAGSRGGWAALGVVLWIALAFSAAGVVTRLWRRRRWTAFLVETARYDQSTGLRMPLPLDFRLEAFSVALGHKRSVFGQEALDHFRAAFGVDDYYVTSAGGHRCWKATDVIRTGAAPTQPEVNAGQVGEKILDTGAGRLLRLIFGASPPTLL